MTIAEQLVQKGLQQGEVKMARGAVIDVLEARFKKVPVSLRKKLESITDRSILEDLLKKAATIASMAEIEKNYR